MKAEGAVGAPTCFFAVAQAKAFPHLEASVRIGIPHVENLVSLSALNYSKE
jgi:hypothetical protein